MGWQTIVALVVMVPVILVPVVLMWYLNEATLYHAIIKYLRSRLKTLKRTAAHRREPGTADLARYPVR